MKLQKETIVRLSHIELTESELKHANGASGTDANGTCYGAGVPSLAAGVC